MTVDLFLMLLTLGSIISALLTETLKKVMENTQRNYSANVLALINAVVVGCGGTAIAYLFLNIPWSRNNIICLVLMSICVWMGSMIGYDKIIQLIVQVKEEKKFL